MTIGDIVLVGELALHIFVPDSESAANLIGEAPVQLGGGIGMMARHMTACDIRPTAVTLTGADTVGAMLRTSMSGVCGSCHHAVSAQCASSIVYIHQPGSSEQLAVFAGHADPSEMIAGLGLIQRDSIAYCPYFPRHEPLVAGMRERTEFTVIDFGHFSWAEDSGAVANRIAECGPGFLAQISGGSLSGGDRRALLAVAKQTGFRLGLCSAAKDGLLGFDALGEFEIPGVPIVPVCTVGAGDVMIAEILMALRNTMTLRDASARGCAAAAAKCQRWGV